MTPRRSVPEELSRDKIMKIARQLFVEQGYRHVTMRQIAQKLKYSHGAIYYHFKNKAELFYAIVEEDFSVLNKKLELVLAEDLDEQEKLKEILLGFIQYGLTYPSQYEMMFLIKDKEINTYLAEGPSQSYDKFAHAIYSLCQGKVTQQEIASIFFSLHGFVTNFWRHGQSYEEVKGIAEVHVRFITRGLFEKN